MPKSKKTSKKPYYKKGYLMSPLNFLGVVFLLAAVIAGVSLVKSNQNISERAAVPYGTATVSIDPVAGNFKTGDTIVSSVNFSTSNIPISGIAVRLIYLYSGSYTDISVKDIKLDTDIAGTGDWTCPTKTSFIMGGNLIVDIACANTTASGFISDKNHLADISVYVNNAPQSSTNTLSVYFDASLSVITQKTDNRDILAIPTSNAVYNIGNIISPTPTGKKECTLKLVPASGFLPVGKSTLLTAVLTGKKVTSVKFISDQPGYVSVSPDSDNKLPYQTTIHTTQPYSFGPVKITAKAYLGQNELCSGVSYIKTGLAPTLSPIPSPRPTYSVQ